MKKMLALRTTMLTVVAGLFALISTAGAETVVLYEFETNNGSAVTNGEALTQIDDTSGNGHHAANNLSDPATVVYSNNTAEDTGFSGRYNNGGSTYVGYCSAAASDDFDTAVGGNLESFTISFQLNWFDYRYGGSGRLVSIVDALGTGQPDFTAGARGWGITFSNSGGTSGTNSLAFFTSATEGGDLGKTSIQGTIASDNAWHEILIVVDGSEGLDTVSATLSIDGEVLGTNTAMPRPKYDNYDLGLFSTGKNGSVLLDNFAIASIPEPVSLSLLTLGGVMLARGRRRRC